jgi:hypothetical protein
MKGRTKASGNFPKGCGFQVGHKSYSYKGMNKGQVAWNEGTAILVECKCLTCGNIFKIRKHQVNRGRGKYCSSICSKKKVAWNKGILETKQCLQCNKPFTVRPCEKEQKFCSQRCVGLANPTKPHWGKYKGINMRSGYEIGYAKYLDRNKTKWEYEPKTFDLGHTSYTPDFYLPEKQIYVEIKGWMRNEALIKIKEFIKQNPDIKYLLLKEDDLKQIGAIK